MTPRPLVLVIDDNPDDVQVIGRILADICEVQFALSGHEGLALARQARPDLILLDVMMPDVDGYKVCAALQADPAQHETPVIFVTSKSDPDSEVRALAAGAVDFIHKPITREVVQARVKLHLALSARARDLKRISAELEQANRELAAISATDRLTGIYNRVKLEAVLDREVGRARRYHSPLCIALLDIDHFKRVNDVHGHATGDAVLAGIAEVLQENIRGTDTVGRWGGDEFLLVLPHTNAGQAVSAAEHVRTMIAGSEFPAVGRKTVSLGVTCYNGDETEAQMLMRADEALYEAKNAGRNRVALRLPEHDT